MSELTDPQFSALINLFVGCILGAVGIGFVLGWIVCLQIAGDKHQ